MEQRIIYQQDDGVAIIIPAPGCGLTLSQIAQKDVPSGAAYWIVDVSEIPVDRTERANWFIDAEEMGSPDGYGA